MRFKRFCNSAFPRGVKATYFKLHSLIQTLAMSRWSQSETSEVVIFYLIRVDIVLGNVHSLFLCLAVVQSFLLLSHSKYQK
jgi:hypothetical protein